MLFIVNYHQPGRAGVLLLHSNRAFFAKRRPYQTTAKRVGVCHFWGICWPKKHTQEEPTGKSKVNAKSLYWTRERHAFGRSSTVSPWQQQQSKCAVRCFMPMKPVPFGIPKQQSVWALLASLRCVYGESFVACARAPEQRGEYFYVLYCRKIKWKNKNSI